MTRRVAVVTTSYPTFAGDPSGHFVATEARELAEAGAEVTVIVPGAGPASGACVGSLASVTGSVCVVPVGGGQLFGWPGVLARAAARPSRLLQLAPWLVRARRALERTAPDELVAHWVVPSVFPLVLGLPLAVDTTTAVSHGSDVRLLLRTPRAVRTHLVRTIAERASRWRFVSHALHDDLARSLDADTARRVARIAAVTPSPIDLPDVRERARELRAQLGDETLYVVAARLVPAKRVDACFAWATAKGARERRSTRIVILGDGPERDALTEKARGLALSSPGLRVDLLGTLARQETLAWIAAADAVLHASREEGLSTVIREAAHYGTPVVAVP
jgi:glycosyltransferase involved in cell wall biosynthesis